MGNIRDFLLKSSTDYIFSPIADASEAAQRTIEPNSGYVSIFLRSMRIVNVRKGWNKFYPVVHSCITLPRIDGQRGEFQVVTSPSRLAELDASHLDRVISLNHRLLGPTPFRGGDLSIELGLFSVKSSDLAKPFLGVLEEMALSAGVAFVSVAKPFIEPLKKGIDLLTGCSDLDLEIGLATTLDKPTSGTFFVMRAERQALKSVDLKLADDLKLVDSSNEPVRDYPYFVFSIEFSDRRDDWYSIPEIVEIHNELMNAVRKGKRNDVDELFSVFKRSALTSPDLLDKDAHRLVEMVEKHLANALPAVLTSTSVASIPPLKSIKLFD